MGQGAVLSRRRDLSFVDEGTEVNPRRRRLVPRPARRNPTGYLSTGYPSRPVRRHIERGQLRTRPALDPGVMQVEAPASLGIGAAAVELVADKR